MYNPPAFREDRPEVLAEAVRAYPLGTLITSGPSGLLANVLPFSLRVEGDQWVLRGHLVKANDQIEDLRQGGEALVMFQGPQAYVSPSWYPTKALHGKAVPTWNYMIVQAWGRSVIHEDTNWLLAQLAELTNAHEAGRAEPWSIADAPEAYVQAQLRGIVGLEIRVTRTDGKWKASQNQPEQNMAGVIDGLVRDGKEDAARVISEAMAG